MKKTGLKYILDATIFVTITSIAGLGLMLAFVIPRGHGGESTFLWLGRHAWGDIHLYLSLLLLVLIPLHLWFNWTWIAQCTEKYIGEQWKRFLWFLAGAWVVVILTAWIAALIA